MSFFALNFEVDKTAVKTKKWGLLVEYFEYYMFYLLTEHTLVLYIGVIDNYLTDAIISITGTVA